MSRTLRAVVLTGFVALVAVLVGPTTAYAATTYGPGGTSGPSLLMSPTSATVSSAKLLTIKITLNTKTTYKPNVYQLGITFDPLRFGCASVAKTTTSPFTLLAATQCDASHARIAAGVPAPAGSVGVQGKWVVATVKLRPTGVRGKTTLRFENITAVADAATSTDVLGATNTSAVTVTQ